MFSLDSFNSNLQRIQLDHQVFIDNNFKNNDSQFV